MASVSFQTNKYSHLVSLKVPVSLRFQASWLSCNLSSLMDSRKVTFLYLLVVGVGAMLFPTFPILSRKLLLEIVLPLYFTPPRVLS